MAQQGKRLKAAYTGFDREKTYALDEAVKLAKGGAKGTYVKKVAVSSTMGPGVKVDVTSLSASAN